MICDSARWSSLGLSTRAVTGKLVGEWNSIGAVVSALALHPCGACSVLNSTVAMSSFSSLPCTK